MNIVYLLTNKNKSSGKRFYIGSKSECKIIKLGGISTMISTTTGKVYMSSSTSFEFKDDIALGHVFEVSILQKLGNTRRKDLVKIENEWIISKDAVNSSEFYNLGHALLNSRDTGKLSNRYGETVKELSRNNSSTGKRDNTAIELGFKNFGEFYFEAYNVYKENGKNWSKTAAKYGKSKGAIRMALLGFNMEKAMQDTLLPNKQLDLRKLIADNCSLVKACKLLNIELPAGRFMLGSYKESRNFTVAHTQGKTARELEIEITKRVLDGEGFREISNSTGLVYETVKRYFFRCIRERVKSSELY